MKEQPEYVSFRIQKNVHNEMINQISYIPENKTILTCSSDTINTMILRHTEKRRHPYVFSVQRVSLKSKLILQNDAFN